MSPSNICVLHILCMLLLLASEESVHTINIVLIKCLWNHTGLTSCSVECHELLNIKTTSVLLYSLTMLLISIERMTSIPFCSPTICRPADQFDVALTSCNRYCFVQLVSCTTKSTHIALCVSSSCDVHETSYVIVTCDDEPPTSWDNLWLLIICCVTPN
jgi:hypothetical protein